MQHASVVDVVPETGVVDVVVAQLAATAASLCRSVAPSLPAWMTVPPYVAQKRSVLSVVTTDTGATPGPRPIASCGPLQTAFTRAPSFTMTSLHGPPFGSL